MRKSKAEWAVIRAAYEGTDETLDELATRFGVARSTISLHAKNEGWLRRHQPAVLDVHALIRRMYRLVERVLVRLETSEEAMDEKDAGVLSRMAAIMDRIVDLQAKSPELPPPGRAKESAEMQMIRKTIARRLEQLGDF